MKFLKASAIVCLIALAMACTSDDSPNVQVSESDLASTWNLTKLDIDGTAAFPGIPIGVPFTGEGKNMDAKVSLSQQPNNITASGNFTIEMSANGVSEDLPITLNELINSGTWAINTDGQLIIGSGTDSQTFDVKEFTGNILKISTEDSLPFSFDGITIEIDAKTDITFERE